MQTCRLRSELSKFFRGQTDQSSLLGCLKKHENCAVFTEYGGDHGEIVSVYEGMEGGISNVGGRDTATEGRAWVRETGERCSNGGCQGGW